MRLHDKRPVWEIATLVADTADRIDSPARRRLGNNSVTLIGTSYDLLGKIRQEVNDAFRRMSGEESPISFTLIIPECMNDLVEVHIFGVLDLAHATVGQKAALKLWSQNNSHLMVNFVEVHNG
jgi:hypothetical protein